MLLVLVLVGDGKMQRESNLNIFPFLVIRTGHVLGPQVRFLARSGDWIWTQAEITLRYKSGTSIPQLWEMKVRVLG